MSLYELLLFLHISAAIIWIGSGTLLNVMAFRAGRANDDEGLRRIATEAGELVKVIFIPSSVATLILGVLVTIEGPWSFGDLWIVLGLAGIAATIFTGIVILTPRTEEIAGMLESGGMAPEAGSKIVQLLTLGRIDLVVLYLVVADMALKPTGDDVGLLVAMAAILVAAAILFTTRARALAATAQRPRAATAGQGFEPR